MALTKIPGELFSVGDLDISNVGTISLDAIEGDADSNTSITFSGSDVITIATGGSNRLTIGDGALSPVTDNQIDLGTSSLEFKDAYFDGTVTSDAFAGPLTGDVTGNVSGTAATVTGAAQSNITSLGTLTTLTVDNVIVNGTTIGHTSDTDLMTLADGVLTVAGEVDATSLDISGDVDVDGTLETDNLTVGGAQGSDGQVLTSTGSGVAWEDASSFNADAAQTFNDSGNDVDFRVESNDSANMLVVDGGDNYVSINANNTASVTNSATALAARTLIINGNEGEGSDNLSFFAMADGTGNYGMEVSNSAHTAQYDLLINPIMGGNVGIGVMTSAAETLDVSGNALLSGSDGTLRKLTFGATGGNHGSIGVDASGHTFVDVETSGGVLHGKIGGNERLKLQDSGPVMTITEAGTDGYETLLKLYRSSTSANEVGMQFDVNGSGGSGQAVGMWAAKGEDWSSGTSRSATLNIQCKDDGTDQNMYQFGNFSDGVNQHKFYTEGAERLRIDQNGVILIGTTSAISNSVVTVHGGDMMVKGDNN